MNTPISATSVGVGGPSVSATQYLVPNCTSSDESWRTTETQARMVVAAGGTLSSLYVLLGTAPGSGKSWAFTLMLNGSATALTCSVSNAGTTASDLSHSVTVSAGDTVSIRSVPTGTPAATDYSSFSVLFGGSVQQSVLTGGSFASSLSASNTLYRSFCGSGVWSAGTGNAGVCPASGTVSNLYVVLATAPGVGKSYAFAVMKNGSPTAVTCTVSGASLSASDLSDSVSFAPGDVLSLRCVPTGTPAVSTAQFGAQFAPATDGESVFAMGNVSNLGSASTRYASVQGGGGDGWDGIEADTPVITQAAVFRSLYVSLSASPGASNSYSFTLRKNGSSGALTCSVANAATTSNDLANSVTTLAGDTVNYRQDFSGSPSSATASLGVVCFISAGGGGSAIRQFALLGVG